MAGHVRLTISSDANAGAIVRALVGSFAETAGAQPSAIPPLSDAVCGVLGFVAGAVYPDAPGELELTLELEKRAVRVQVHDWGRPLTAAGGDFGAVPDRLARAAPGAVDLRIVNLGRGGKVTSFSWPLELPKAAPTSTHALGAAEATAANGGSHTAEAIELRDATPDDGEAISRLLYDHYALGYVHSDFYRPRWVAQQLQDGALRSTVALHGGDMIGHHALIIFPGQSWAESGVAVVHPAYRGLGVFGRMMKRTLAKASELKLDAVCGEAVTIHPYSQRAEHAFGYRASALTLGSLPPLGSDGNRQAQLLSYRMLSASRRAVRVPGQYREALLDAYLNLDLEADGSPLAAATEPAMRWSRTEERRAARVAIAGWDEQSEGLFGRGLRGALASHVDVVFADVDLALTEDLQTVVESLNRRGFFYAGLRPCALGGNDALRMQRLNSRNLELERIVCDSEFARELLAVVLEDRQRVEQLAG